jgi:hypothetical protein
MNLDSWPSHPANALRDSRARTCQMIAALDAWIETKRLGFDPAVVRIYPKDHPMQRAFMAATDK